MPDELQQAFTEHGLRCTRQRRAIYNALVASRCHPTADELHKAIQQTNDARLSLATVYNTMEVLCNAGLAYKLAGCGENGSTRYDVASDDHMHLRCRKTGMINDVPDDLGKTFLEHLPDELLKEVEQRLGFKVCKVQVDLIGEFDQPPEADLPPRDPSKN